MNYSLDRSYEKKLERSIYDRDYALWIRETIDNLSNRNFQALDLDNLIEEVSSLGKSEQRAIRSYLTRLFEHLLKRCYVDLADCYRGWEREIRNFRNEIDEILNDSPSLKAYVIKVQERCYQKSLNNVKEDYLNSRFPVTFPFDANSDRLLERKY